MATVDPTLKSLVEIAPADWLPIVDQPAARVEVIDADISTVSGAADKVLRVYGDDEWLMHLEFHAGHDGAELPPNLHARNALLHKRHGLPVQTLVVVLKREANSPHLDGVLTCRLPFRSRPYVVFEYEVRRVWQMPPEVFLNGGLGVLPLAPIADVTEARVPGIIRQMNSRLTASQASELQIHEIWSATFFLLGLRFSPEFATRLLRGVRGMKESTTYQAVLSEGIEIGLERGLEQGRLQEARALLVELATPHLGVPDASVTAALEAITDLTRLRELRARISTVTTWYGLLDLTPPRPSRRRRREDPPRNS